MRDISIHFLKKTPRLFFFIRRVFYWPARKIFFFKRFKKKRSNRVARYRRLIDGSLRKKINPDYEKISKKIEKKIHKITKIELKLTSKWWLLFIRLIDSKKGSSDINKCINDLYNETLRLSFTKNSSFALLELYALLLEYGMYRIGFIIRSQGTKLVLKEGINQTSSENTLKRYISAAFEEVKYDELQDSLEKLIAINKDNEEILLLDLLLHKIIIKKSNKKIIKDQYIDKNYLEIIKGQRVAIVGPAQNDLNNGKEIDSFDVIIRFNYKGENISVKNYGSRTDISYFNGANTWDIENKYKKLKTNDLKAAVYKVPVRENYLGCKCNRRMFLPLEHCMLDNSPNALPNMIADLLIYQPQEIKIFSIDMGISSKRDISYGIKGELYWDRYYPKAGHDPYSQFNFVKNCYKNNLIRADHTLKEILELEISEYMDELQNTYLDKALFTVNL